MDQMTHDTTTAMPGDAPSGLYARLWRRFPRDVGYLALTGVIVVIALFAWAAVLAVFSSFSVGLGTIVLLALLVLGLLWFGRVFGPFEIVRLSWAGAASPPPVAWRTTATQNRFLRIVEVARDPHFWLYGLFTAIVFPALGFVVSAVSAGLALLAVGLFIGAGPVVLAAPLLLPQLADQLDGFRVVVGIGALIVGLGFVALLPFVTRGCVRLQGAVATAMLGGFPSEQLALRLKGLEVSRSAAVSAEGTALRRLERDIHDGPQQRLVRIQMDLAAAARAVDTDVEKGKGLIEDALQHSRDALDELRALSRGFAPPLLLDRGLAAALEAVVDRSAVPTRFTNELPEGFAIPTEIERNAYFIAAELLANVSKHSEADRADLILSATGGETAELRIVVSDDGRGGAALAPAHGLVGIEERLIGLGGRLELRSPVGGPTHVRVHVPVPYAPEDTVAASGTAAPEKTAAPDDAPPESELAPDPELDLAETVPLEGATPTLAYPTEELPRR